MKTRRGAMVIHGGLDELGVLPEKARWQDGTGTGRALERGGAGTRRQGRGGRGQALGRAEPGRESKDKTGRGQALGRAEPGREQ